MVHDDPRPRGAAKPQPARSDPCSGDRRGHVCRGCGCLRAGAHSAHLLAGAEWDRGRRPRLRFRPGFWASLDANFFFGGRQTVAGRELVDEQRNSRIGETVVVPFKGRHAVKVGFATGIFTEFGTDFDQYQVSYQVLFR